MNSAAERIISLYEEHAASWAARRGEELRLERAWFERFCSRLRSGAHVLDLGCGSGSPIAGALIGQGFQVTGVDAAPSLIGFARARLPGATWIVTDMRSLALTTRFDGIIAWHSLFHLTGGDQRSLFRVMAQHAAPGAPLMFTSGPTHGESIGRFHGEPLYHASLSPAEYRSLLTEHGFEVRECVQNDPDCGGATVWLAESGQH